jgi:glycosyltransferase involved in cell wall biosynthesis
MTITRTALADGASNAPASPPSYGSRPLRILEVASGLPNWGGTEIHLVNLSEQLVARGHSVTISCQPGRFVEAEAKRRGLDVAPAVVRSQTDFRARRDIQGILRAGNFDVVHVHWAPDYIVTPILARMARVPVVLMSHHSPHPFKSGARRWLFAHGLFDRVIALSESVRTMLLGQGLRPDQVVTIHHGTDTDTFRSTSIGPSALRAEWHIPAERFVAGIVGRVAVEKGIPDFIGAVGKLQGRIHGVIVGDSTSPEYLAELRDVAARAGASDYLTFAGFRADVNNAIGALDALVLASTWNEPCAAVVQQAGCLGKPVVGTNLGGTPEMIVDGRTGILVPPSSSDAIANALGTLASDRERAAAMGAAGRQRIEERFTQRGMVDRIEALYAQELLARGGRR